MFGRSSARRCVLDHILLPARFVLLSAYRTAVPYPYFVLRALVNLPIFDMAQCKS